MHLIPPEGFTLPQNGHRNMIAPAGARGLVRLVDFNNVVDLVSHDGSTEDGSTPSLM